MGNSASISILFVVFSIASLPRALADYAQMTLFEMLAQAETVVAGEIRKINVDSYDLVVEEAFRSAAPGDVLTVQRVDGLHLGKRWDDYREGQNIVLFAAPAAREGATLTPLGAAGEGELPKDATDVYLPTLSRPPEHLERTILGGSLQFYRIDATEFHDAISGFERCYRRTQEGRFAQLCQDQALTDYRKGSWLAEHVASIADRLPEGEN